MLRNEWCIEALVFLGGADPPDSNALDEPARDTFLSVAEKVHGDLKTMSSLYPDAFDWETRPVLSVAGRFRDYGVDYAPAIHNLRSAMDEPRWDQGQFKH